MLLNSILIWLSIFTTVFAEKYMKTDSLLTCMENSQFTATHFEVVFNPSNGSAYINIQAISTFSGNIYLKGAVYAYGLKIYDISQNVCDLDLEGVCPFPSGTNRFSLKSYYTLDSSFTKDVPNIAYTIPDLDAKVRVLVYQENDTSTALACVEATLDNGKTVQTKYASWPIAAIAGTGLIVSGVYSLIGHSNTAAHIASNSISLFVYFQNLAITSMMAVARIPPIGAAWCQNFQWSMGIMNVAGIQKAIQWYVQATGGKSAVVQKNKDLLSISVQKRGLQLIEAGLPYAHHVLPPNLVKRLDLDYDATVLDDEELYTTDEFSSNLGTRILVLRGIQRVAYLAGIDISNFFLTGIVFLLFFLFVILICIVSFRSIAEILVRTNVLKNHKLTEFRRHWSLIVKGTFFRMTLIALPQVSLLCLWEFTEKDSAAVVVVAVFMLVITVGLLVYGIVRVMIVGKQSKKQFGTAAYLLYGDAKMLNRFGFLYVQFQADKYWWLIPIFVYTILRSIFVGLVQGQGKAQALGVFIIELFYFGILCWKKPFMDKRTNVFNILIHLVNLINSILFLFFSNLFHQPAIVSSVCAIVLFVLNAVFALFLLIFTIVTCVLALVSKNPDLKYHPVKDDRVSFIPRVGDSDPKNDNLELNDLGAALKQGQNDSLLRAPNEVGYTSPLKFQDNDDTKESLSAQDAVVPSSSIYGNMYNNKGDTSYHSPLDVTNVHYNKI